MDEKVDAPATPAATPGFNLGSLRVRLVNDYKEVKTKGTFLFAAFMTLLSGLGPSLRETWLSMPDELKNVIPAGYQRAISYALIFLLFIAVRYGKVERRRGDDAAN